MDINKATILRAWKDEEFRQSLPAEQRDAIPARPTGADGSELTDEQLEQAAGGTTPACIGAIGVSVAIEEAWD
jgi:mersacidin/lichenicidin family type 2 lantibiotic